MKTQNVEIKATSPEAKKLLKRALKWVRRIEERAEDLPPSFMDNCDPKPLRKAIEAHFGLTTKLRHSAPARKLPMQPNQTDTQTAQQTEGGDTVASSALFGDVFVVVIEDRHCDTSVEVWTDREAAIASARALAKEYCRHQDDYHEETIQGWEFYVRYSCEGDSTRVVKVTVRQSPNDKLRHGGENQ